MNCFDDYGTSGAPPVRSNYIRKDEALDDLWENSVATGINFAKYEDIKVQVKGENIPQHMEKFTEAGRATSSEPSTAVPLRSRSTPSPSSSTAAEEPPDW